MFLNERECVWADRARGFKSRELKAFERRKRFQFSWLQLSWLASVQVGAHRKLRKLLKLAWAKSQN